MNPLMLGQRAGLNGVRDAMGLGTLDPGGAASWLNPNSFPSVFGFPNIGTPGSSPNSPPSGDAGGIFGAINAGLNLLGQWLSMRNPALLNQVQQQGGVITGQQAQQITSDPGYMQFVSQQNALASSGTMSEGVVIGGALISWPIILIGGVVALVLLRR